LIEALRRKLTESQGEKAPMNNWKHTIGRLAIAPVLAIGMVASLAA
jgi:hypothetical protein